MKLTIDTDLLDDPNHFGELLRNYCFIPDKFGGTTGCYSTFDLKPEFKKLEGIAAKFHVKAFLRSKSFWGSDFESANISDEFKQQQTEVYERFLQNVYSNGDIVLFWAWDGDGSLIIKTGTKCAYNNDCKKDYVWEWVE